MRQTAHRLTRLRHRSHDALTVGARSKRRCKRLGHLCACRASCVGSKQPSDDHHFRSSPGRVTRSASSAASAAFCRTSLRFCESCTSFGLNSGRNFGIVHRLGLAGGVSNGHFESLCGASKHPGDLSTTGKAPLTIPQAVSDVRQAGRRNLTIRGSPAFRRVVSVRMIRGADKMDW